MKYFNKNNIIKNMHLIILAEKDKDSDKSKEYSLFLKNIIAYPNEINYLKDLDNIKGLTKDIKIFMKELKKNNEISYIKDLFINEISLVLIIYNLEIIRDYEIYNNEILKVNAYNKAINNLFEYPYDFIDLKDLKKIKGIGKTMISMITDLKTLGYIPYIEKIIKKDEIYSKSITTCDKIIKKDEIYSKSITTGDKIIKKDEIYSKSITTGDKIIKFDKSSIINHLKIICYYEIYNNNIDKAKAYINAILNIHKYDNEISKMKDLKNIKGIGKAITQLINELKNTGKINYIDTIINKDKQFIITTEKYRKLFNKEELIKLLEIIKDYETYNNEIYKVKAYRNAINNILIYHNQITSINDFDNIEGLGTGILEKIYEYFLTGKISYIENNIKIDKIYEFKKELLHIYGIGPINAKKIIEKGIQNIEQLKKNKNLLNDKQKLGLKYYDDLKLRIPLIEYKKHIKILKKDLDNLKLTFDFVGSYRRGSNNMGDIDLLIMENDKFNLKNYISKLIDDNYIIDVLASGKNKFMGIVKLNDKPARRLDILVAPVNEYYYSLLYFTGSNIFNIGLRNYVKNTLNLSLSEHGFNKQIPVKNEEDIFKYLKLKYVKPIDRNNF